VRIDLAVTSAMKKSTAAQVFSIRRFMTASPHTIGPEESLATALERMGRLGVRHLPVLDQGKHGRLVGILTERDLRMLQAITDRDPDRIPVSAAMQTDVYGVDVDTPLDEVAATMASHKYGSAVVWSGGAVVGIFTSVDAMRTLAELVRKLAR
jgi:acetoin utilization protein AcuB